jgi:hypothetical protein
MLNEGNQTLNFILCVCENFVIPFYYGSGTVTNYASGADFLTSYGSGSIGQKVTVTMVPVPVPQHCLHGPPTAYLHLLPKKGKSGEW